MATVEQIEEGIRRADKAGDAESVRALGAELLRMRREAKPKPHKRLSALEMMVNAPASIVEGVAQVADLPMQASTGIQRGIGYAIGHGGGALLDLAGYGGAADRLRRSTDVADAALARTPTMAGAVERAVPSLERMPASARFTGNFMGGLLVPIGPKAKPRGPRLLPPTTPVRTSKRTIAEPRVAAAFDQAAESPIAPLGRRAVVRDAQMKAAGVRAPTTGMVTRDPRIWHTEREASKLHESGDEMLAAIKGVEDDLVTAAHKLVDESGGAIGQEATGARVGKVLADKNEALNRQVGALYTKVREQVGDARVPDLANLKSAERHPEWADNAEFDSMSAAINKRLLNYADADGGASGLSVGQSEELRKFIGNLGPNTSQGYAMRRVFQDALDTDVLDNFGGAPFAQARAAAAARFAEFRKTLPGKVADGEIPAERLSARVMTTATPLKDLRQLRRSLTTGGEKGTEALDTLGAQVMDDLLGKNISADGKVNGGAIFKQFQAAAPRLQIILGPQRYKQMRRLAVAARYATTEVPFSAVNNSNTASAAANLFTTQASAKGGTILPNLARRIAGTAIGGSGGGFAGALAGDAAAQAVNKGLANRATKAASEYAASQVALLKNPEAAARAIAEAAADPKVDPILRRFAQGLVEAMKGSARRTGTIPTMTQNLGRGLNNNAVSRAAADQPRDQQEQQ